MAWRRRRWDELRGSAAPENAAYLSAIWERLRPDDRVLDVGSGPGSVMGWMAEFAPDLALLGLDLAWPALEEAGRVAARHPNVRLARASSRRRLPIRDDSTDVVLRRLAPGLPEEIIRVLAPGGHYLRFTFGSNHWREIYDRVPGLPRAREDAIAGEAARLADLGLEVLDPVQTEGEEELTLPSVMLALRSNPAAFHMARVDLDPMRQLWFDDGRRLPRARLSTEYVVLVARKPPGLARVRPTAPPAQRPVEAEAPAAPAAEVETATTHMDGPPVERPTAATRRRRTAAAAPGETPAAGPPDEPAPRRRRPTPGSTEPAPSEKPAPGRRRATAPSTAAAKDAGAGEATAAQEIAAPATNAPSEAEAPSTIAAVAPEAPPTEAASTSESSAAETAPEAAAPKARRSPRKGGEAGELGVSKIGEPGAESRPVDTPPPEPGTTARPRRSGRSRASAEPSD
jgi:SAM-dependent methyltransferase